MILTRKTMLIGAIITSILAISAVTVTLVVLENKDDDVINYVEHDPIVIWGDEDFDDYNFPGKGTENNPYRISEYNITTESYKGISIWNTKKYFIIENCYVNADEIGISIESVAPGSAKIRNNICYLNTKIGLLVYKSPEISIENNECNNNGYGIVIDSSSSCSLIENTCNNNEIGLIIYYSATASVVGSECSNNNLGLHVGYSSSANVEDCKITNNNEGISTYQSPVAKIEGSEISYNTYGIIMQLSRSSIIKKNEIHNNSYGVYLEQNSLIFLTNNSFTYNAYGIYFKNGADSNTIRFNYFELNYLYAIKIEFSNDNNSIYYNSFVNNSASVTSQAYDNGLNIWYDFYSNSGNYWDDYIGVGSYAIDGLSGNSDPYPLETSPLT